MHSLEQIKDINTLVDNEIGKVWAMSIEISWLKDICPSLDSKQTFVATQLIESACMMNEKTKKMILAFDQDNLLPNLQG